MQILRRAILLVATLFCLVPVAQAGVPTVGLSQAPGVDFWPRENEAPQDVIRRCLLQYGVAHILPGTYQFTAPLSVPYSNIRITGTKGAKLKPSTSSVGLFSFTGDRITLDGFAVEVSTYTNDQSVIKFTSSDDITVNNVTMDVTTSSGSSSNPLTLVHFVTSANKKITGNSFFPNTGVRILYDESNDLDTTTITQAGSGLQVIGNYFGTDNMSYTETPRNCYRVMQLLGTEFNVIVGNRFWQMGAKTTAELDKVIFIRKHGNLAISGAGSFDLIESGHMMILGNTFERCASPSIIELWGAGSCDIVGNVIGLSAKLSDGDGCSNAAGEGAIQIYGDDGTRTGIKTETCLISGNELHNLATAATDGAFIYATRIQSLKITGNSFQVCSSNNAIRIDGNKTERTVITSNTFRSATGASKAINIVNVNSDGQLVDGLLISNNDFEGFAAGNPIAVDSVFTTASGRRVVVTGLQDTITGNDATALANWTNSFTSTNITFETATDIIKDSTTALGVAGFAVGDQILVRGSSVAGNNKLYDIIAVTTGTPSSVQLNANITDDLTSGESIILYKVAHVTTTNVRLDQ